MPGPREVSLVLCDAEGTVVGGAGPFRLALPWWQHVEDVVAAAAGSGLDVTVARLLGGEPTPGWRTAGGRVTYLAELHAGTTGPLPSDVALDLSSHPLRQPWAVVGGPAADLDWAVGALEGAGHHLAGRPVQIRTWNLSSIWRLPLVGRAAWLKAVPAFFAHEGAVIRWVASRRPGLVPEVLAAAPGRVVLAEVGGDDQYGAGVDVSAEVAGLVADLQVSSAHEADDLFALGATDWRLAAYEAEAAAAFERHTAALEADERVALATCLAGLGARSDALVACGLPETLVHGDLHAGNVRRGGGATTLLDWGDSGVGHPLLDVAELLRDRPADELRELAARACATWAALVPGADPVRALDLLAPLAPLRRAVVFERFLATIEPSERCYHAHDPLLSLRATAAALRR